MYPFLYRMQSRNGQYRISTSLGYQTQPKHLCSLGSGRGCTSESRIFRGSGHFCPLIGLFIGPPNIYGGLLCRHSKPPCCFLCLRLIHWFDSDVSAVILRVPAAERNARNGQLRVDPWESHPSGDFPKPPSLPDSPIKGCCDWTEVALSSCVLRHSGSHTRFASLSVVYRSLR